MSKFGFCGGSYTSQAVNADAQMCMNLMPEKVESGAGKSDLILVNTPGKKLFATLPDTPCREGGQVEINGRHFVVSGATLYEVFSDGSNAKRGTVGNDGNPVSLAASLTELMVASAGNGYCMELASNAITGPIANIAGVTQVGYSDGFFVALVNNALMVSGPLDGTIWDPSQKAIVSVFPGKIVSLIVDHREVCLLGNRQSVCYYDSGNQFPYDVVPQGFMEMGSAAQFAAAKIDNTYFWIGQDERGAGIAWRAQGYTPVRISTHAIEAEWAGYSTIVDATAYVYQDGGHTFYVVRFPTADKTWVYDVATGFWHQRGFWSAGVYKSDRACSHAYVFGKHLIGDPLSGNIYQMAMPKPDGAGAYLFADDFGNPKRWLRRSPYISSAADWLFFKKLRFDIEVGLGPIPALQDGSGKNRDPQVMLRWSDTSTKTWSDERVINCGQAGNYKVRVFQTRMGRADGTIGRVFELSGSDPIPWRITDADVEASPDYPQTQRLATRLRQQA